MYLLSKTIFEIANSKFLRKFAQLLRSDIDGGGSKLQFRVESPANHC